MKKIIDWVYRKENIPFVILMILILPLYVFFYGNYINEKTTEFLVAIAAIVSTILLYLSLRENWKANHLKMLDPKFSDLSNEVLRLEGRSHNCIFTEPQFISSRIKYPDDYVLGTTYSNFLNLINLYNAIRIDNSYKNCIERLEDTSETTIEFDENVNNLDYTMNQFIEGNRNIMRFLFSIADLYTDIDKSELFNSQKKYLIDKMNILYNPFSRFYKSMKAKDNDEYEMFKNFYNFKLFKVTDNNRIGVFRSDVQWQFVFMSCKDIETIKTKHE